MAVHCVFFTPRAKRSCQVLCLVDASPKSRQTQEHLESRYCQSGRFIACPIFCRVEQGLVEANRVRVRLAREASSGMSGDPAFSNAQAQSA